jgi:hypothetical protein
MTPIPTPAEAGQAFPQGEAGASENSPMGYFSEQACLPRWPPCKQAPSLNQPTGLVLYARPSPWGKQERGLFEIKRK